MTRLSQSNFYLYDPEEELQKACVLLAEEYRPLGLIGVIHRYATSSHTYCMYI